MFGINISGGEFGSGQGRYGWDYIYPSAQTIQYYADKGFDTIRLPVKWERLQHSLNGSLDAAEMNRIKAVLDVAEANGMKVVLDIHNYAYYNSGTIGTSSVPISSFANLWGKLAAELKSHPAVEGYGLMNEPIGFTNTQTWPDAAQAAINAIRAVDGETAIYVAGQNWGSAMNWPENNDNLKYLQDSSNNLVFEAHQYFDRWNSGTYQGTYDSEGAYANVGVDRLQPFLNWLEENNLKGFIGEYAVPDNDPRWLTVIDNFLTELAEHNIPSAYWGGGPWWGSYPMSIEPENGIDAPQMGILLKHIEAHALAQGDDDDADDNDDDTVVPANEDEGDDTAPDVEEEPQALVMELEGTARSETMTVSAGHIGLLRGMLGNDRLNGAELADALYGDGGNDYLVGGAGADYLSGGDGADRLYGGEGDDGLSGGTGNDYLYGDAGDDVMEGGDGNDYLYGGAGADLMSGDEGHDRLYGQAGDDEISGAGGNDYLYGHEGNDTLHGGIGNDYLEGGYGDDTLNGGDGLDKLYGGDGDDILNGDAGADRLYGGNGNNLMDGGADNDLLYGGTGIDTMHGGTGNDYLYGYNGNDMLYGGDGNDIIYGHNDDDMIEGGAGNDRAWGGYGNDTIYGGSGTDYLYGDIGNDIVYGEDDNDVIYGGIGDDTLYGGDGNDYLNGGTQNDILHGGDGNDRIYGDVGNDTLKGGNGADALYGGRGSDIFVFESGTAFSGVDTIYDFNKKELDKIDLSSLLGGYDPLTHAITDFVEITTSGRNSILKVDVDGGGDNFVQIATIAGVTGLTDEQALVNSGHLVVS